MKRTVRKPIAMAHVVLLIVYMALMLCLSPLIEREFGIGWLVAFLFFCSATLQYGLRMISKVIRDKKVT